MRNPKIEVTLIADEGEKVVKRCLTDPHICRNGISRGWIIYKRRDVPIAHRRGKWLGYPYSL